MSALFMAGVIIPFLLAYTPTNNIKKSEITELIIVDSILYLHLLSILCPLEQREIRRFLDYTRDDEESNTLFRNCPVYEFLTLHISSGVPVAITFPP